MVQLKFFSGTERGFPKSQVRRACIENYLQMVATDHLDSDKSRLTAYRAIHMVKTGGEEAVVKADLLSLPGLGNGPCDCLTEGFDVLYELGGDWADIVDYLRAVLEPFKFAGDVELRTILSEVGEVRAPLSADGFDALAEDAQNIDPASEETGNEGEREDEAQMDHEANVHAAAIDVASTAVAACETLDDVVAEWCRISGEMEALAREASSVGPNPGSVANLRVALEALEALRERAELLAPRAVPTAPLVERLGALIASIREALIGLVGEDGGASLLASELDGVADEVNASAYQEAEQAEADARERLASSIAIAREIAQLDATLPIKTARERTGPLLDRREEELRKALYHAGVSFAALTVASVTAATPLASAQPAQPQPIGSVAVAPQPAPKAEAAIFVKGGLPIAVSPTIATISKVDEGVGELLSDDLFEVPEEIKVPPPAAHPAELAPAPVSDPLRDDIVARLDKLFELGEFGLAYHLRTAAQSLLPDADLVYEPAEFRLAAAAGRAKGLSGQDLQQLAETRSDATAVAQRLEDLADGRSVARRITLLAAAIPPALLRSDDVTAISLVERVGGKGQTSHYFTLVSAIQENRNRNFPMVASNLAAAEAHESGDKFLKESVAAIKCLLEGFRAARFRFQLGEKVKHALFQSDALLGRLSRGLDADAHAVARETSEQLQSRDAIVEILSKLSNELGYGQEIDGPARERIVGILSQIGQECRDLSRAMDSLSALRQSGGGLDVIQRLRDTVLSGIDHVIKETSEGSGDVLVDAANAHAHLLLGKLKSTVTGRGPQDRDQPPLAVGLHGPLLWLPGLTWTGGWIPSPYDPEQLVQAIMTIHLPLLADDPAGELEKAFEARRAEGAFVAAYMLLNISGWYGMAQERTAALAAKLEADKETRKAQVRVKLDRAESLINRMRRMAVGSLEQSARLKETLSTINPDRLPVDLPASFLPEAISGDRVEDFNSALSRIDAVEREATKEFQKVTASFEESIEELRKDGRLDADTGKQLRSLLERFEFTTLADWLNILKGGEGRKPLLPSGVINKRLETFRAALPSLASLELLRVAEALEAGEAVGPVNYRHLDKDRRDDGAKVVRRFLDLKRMVKNTSANMSQVQATVTDVVSNLVYEVSHPKDDMVLTRARQQIYVYDAKIALPPADPTSLLLPEFGSLTQGAWRICVVSSTVSVADIISLGEGAGLRGVAVFMLGTLPPEKRAQLRLELTKRKRPMLVIDEALLAVAMADVEDRRRALIEIAQGYSGADPYKDHGKSAVPVEMFKGRAREIGEIVNPFGSYVVFGGRRLGKTALLRHVHATQPSNAVFAYVDLDMVMSPADAFEQISKKIGAPVMKSKVSDGPGFSGAVTAWLAEDQRRRVLLMIDEADNLVRLEAETGFRCIQTMIQLMAETKNRFKVVLAGLHNVSRIVRAENNPLSQISNGALRIGPLVDRDVDDAEFLVRGPLAAMGYEFDSREDVWRILSFLNYYPVLIQVFCQELLRLVNEQAQQSGKLPKSISSSIVEKALTSSDVRGKLFATFEKTIVSIEGRYELITYILAVRELLERDSGMAAEGLSPAEVAERAMECWPAAFPKGSDPIELEYLLEEMEGFGIARRTSSNRFALRSRSLLELMAADETELRGKLSRFKNEKAPDKPFDPKNYRRRLGKPLPRVVSDGRICPLTDGQESDLLAPERGVAVVFGSAIAGIQLVEPALLDARRIKDGLVRAELRTFASKRDLLAETKRIAKGVLVVTSATIWHPDWVVEAERIDKIRNGQLRVVFVGDPKHAKIWSSDTMLHKRALPQVKIVRLRPWTRSFLGGQIDALQLGHELVDRIIDATGGWNEVTDPLMAQIAERPREAQALVAAAAEKALASKSLLADLGLPEEQADFFRELAAYAKGSTITSADFVSLCTWEGRKFDPKQVGAYGDLIGLFSYPFERADEPAAQHEFKMNPLALAALAR